MSSDAANAIACLIFDALFFWACWDIPHPYFVPAVITLALLSRIQFSLVRLRAQK
jgi:hypothetical protein